MLTYSIEVLPKQGQVDKVGGLVTKARDVLAEATGHAWSAWANLGGSPYGTYMLTTRVEGTTEMIDGQVKAATSAEFQGVSADMAPLVDGTAEPTIAEIIGVTGEMKSAPPIVLYTMVALSGGGLAASIDWAHRIAQHAADTTGVGTTIAMTTTGPMYNIGWVAGFDDGAAVDAMNASLAGDAGYIALLDEATQYVEPTSGTRKLIVRLP